ncbi:MAG: nucleoside recognition domain-containing protein [Oscillospiraceae bacterium]
MSIVFSVLLLGGIVFGALTGRMEQVSAAALGEASRAVELVLSLTGNFCLWGGMMKIAQEAGLTRALSRAASPLLRRLFIGLRPDGAALGAITMNLAANLMGLGNAATPLGIAAMQQMEREERAGNTATNNMVLFVVMNTASLQLLPTTTAMLRSAAGSAAPLEILPAVWAASAVSVAAGISVAKLLGRRR